ncbi:Metallo-dependent phosphatase [Patellaria atrata CBS 101060]|uniref:Metallo-dependent phosphatase n=1 Tax=Patellaria atrata CBS 101060 TaxID=1346257 RepID=A0A9P4VNQ3_9PEZI|nr:Metallo-dependent phosphatase [Patellaria atrata CBS 101060]
MASQAVLKRKTRFVCISDTHNQRPKLPKGDVFIHAGDLSNQGSLSELRKTVEWIEGSDFDKKIVIAGNHDITLDAAFYKEHGAYFHNQHPQDPAECLKLFTESSSITYLNHESTTVRLTSADGPHTEFKVFGSPYSPKCGSWAFQYDSADAPKIWAAIPLDSDVVITHTPPKGHCDWTTNTRGPKEGCEMLRRALWRVRPSLAICGHVHGARGVERVRWKLDMPRVKFMEGKAEFWTDPGAGNQKQSLVNLTAKGGNPLDNNGLCKSSGKANNVTFLPGDGASSEDTDFSQLETHDVEALIGRMGRRETCIVNAAIMAPRQDVQVRFNKPIVIDIDLPVWV